MTESFELNTGETLFVAGQHDDRADGLVEEGKQPVGWLDSFLENYGRIALPMKHALDLYYAERERAYNALADQHRYMGDALRAFVNDMQNTDDEGAHDIRNALNGRTFEPEFGASGPSLTGPSGASPTGPVGTPDRPASQPAAAGVNGSNGAELAGAPTAPLAGPVPPAATDGQPRPQGPSEHGETSPAAGPQPPPGGPPPGGGPSGGGPGPGVVVPPVAPPGSTPSVAPPGSTPSVAGTPSGQVPGEPVPPVPVFPGAVPAGQRKAAEPSPDVDPGVNDDLVLARTLLAAVLAAVAAGGARQSTSKVAWSVSVMRGPSGPSVFVTTNEGRGWLPAGLYLPREMSVPSLSEVADDAPAKQEIADPASVLAEFARAWEKRSGARLTALVSSAGIDDGLRAQVGESVGVEGNVQPARSDVDLSAPGAGLVDRLTAVGGETGNVPEGQVMVQCVRLAVDAHGQVVRTVAAGLERTVREVAVARGLREQICAAAQAGREVPEQLWRALWDADAAVEAALAGHRSQVGTVDLGDDRDVVSQLLFERRCNELVLLLANGASQQTLRDVTYSHGQVLDHPAFGRAPVAAAEVRGDRPAVAAPGGVLAPPVSPPAATPPTSSADDQAGRS